MSLTPAEIELFWAQGFLGPRDLLPAAAAARLGETLPRLMTWQFRMDRWLAWPVAAWHWLAATTYLGRAGHPGGPDGPRGRPVHWLKSVHVRWRPFRALGRHPEILAIARDLLGQDLLLWGAQLVTARPGRAHNWHVDIEHTAWEGVTFWIPLKNVSPASTIKFITGSHRLAFTPRGQGADASDAALAAARRADAAAAIYTAAIAPGQVCVFAGRTWHATINETPQPRQAVILQYCRPDARVRVPLNYDEPVWGRDQPWVMLVAGEDRFGRNFLA